MMMMVMMMDMRLVVDNVAVAKKMRKMIRLSTPRMEDIDCGFLNFF